MTEAQIQADIISALIKDQVGVMRVNTIKAKTKDGAVVLSYIFYAATLTDGATDLIAFKDGKAWFLEVKRPGQTLRKSQITFKGWCDWYNMPHHVVTSVEEAMQAINTPTLQREGL